jgi:hypothetical protein
MARHGNWPHESRPSYASVRVPSSLGLTFADSHRSSLTTCLRARAALPCGDYGVTINGTLVAAVERKSLSDLMSSLTSGRLRYAMSELAGLPRAAVVVEDRYPRIFAQTLVRPAVIADGLAELQVRVPSVPIVFCDSRKLAEEWTYRWLAAAYAWALDELPAVVRMGTTDLRAAAPSNAELREWAKANGRTVSDRGRLPTAVVQAWQLAHVAR